MNERNQVTRCKKCKGTGFQKKKEIFICKNCGSKYNCMLCENIRFKGIYEECDNCLGIGEIKSPISLRQQAPPDTKKISN